MKIIPVIDLLAGQVVHAKRGERGSYQPIESMLCKGSQPITVCKALLELYPFDTLYIADLDAIQKQGDHWNVIADIRTHFPALQLWFDGGFSEAQELIRWQPLGIKPVIGSESLTSLDDYRDIKRISPSFVLSLDYKIHGYEGPRELLNKPDIWPNEVIGMTLQRVGSNMGPDIETLTRLQQQRTDMALIAAGGVKEVSDLVRLKDMGIAGTLVATALHNGSITHQDLQQLKGSQTHPKAPIN